MRNSSSNSMNVLGIFRHSSPKSDASPTPINSCSTNRASVIWSIKNGELDELKEVLELSEIDINQEINGRYLLHYAAEYGHCEIVRFLLSQNAKVNVVDEYGITPILCAIYEGHSKCVEMLLQQGASTSFSTPDGKSYREAADKEEIRQLLTQYEEQQEQSSDSD